MVSPRMPFGKHRGKLLSEIPSHYLAWLLREADLYEDFRCDVEAELASAERQAERSRRHRAYRGRTADSAGPRLPASWPDVVRSWYRQMSLDFHPDRGGSHEAQKVINEGYRRLQELLKAS